jgi:HlyD family secretion protein
VLLAAGGTAVEELAAALEGLGCDLIVRFDAAAVVADLARPDAPAGTLVVDGTLPDRDRAALYDALRRGRLPEKTVVVGASGAPERTGPLRGLVALSGSSGAEVQWLAKTLAAPDIFARPAAMQTAFAAPVPVAAGPRRNGRNAPGRDVRRERAVRLRAWRISGAAARRLVALLGAVALAGAAALGAAGIGQWKAAPTPVEAQQATPVAAPLQPRATVQRGTITGSVRAAGKIAGAADTAAAFAAGGRIKSLLVGVGDQVQAGQSIAELEADDVSQKVAAATTDVRVLQLRVDQARGRPVSDQDVTLAQANVDRAEAELRRVQQAQAQVGAPPPAAAQRNAEQAVAVASARLDAARAALDRAQKPVDPAVLASLQQSVDAAALERRRAEADSAAVKARSSDGLSPEALALAQAKLNYQSAVAALSAKQQNQATDQRVLRETLSAQVRAAQNEVERAEIALRQADWRVANPPPPTTIDGRPVPVDPSAAPEAANIARAALVLARQNLALTKLREQQALASDTATAQSNQAAYQASMDELRRTVDKTKTTLDEAEATFRQAASRASAGLSDQDLALARAKLAYDQAVHDLEARRAGTPPDEIAALQREVSLAEGAQAAAAAALQDLNAPPSQEQVAAAASAVEAARASVTMARADLNAKRQAVAARASDQALETRILQEQLAHAQDGLAAAQQVLAASVLTAPAAGTVVSVEKKLRDSVETGEPVVFLTDPAALFAAATFDDADAAGLAPGMAATLTSPSLPNRTFSGAVSAVESDRPEAGGANRTSISLVDPPPGLRAGLPVDVQIEGVTRNDALLVPARAVRQIGSRRTVTLVTDRERDVEVKLGLASGDLVQVTGALREGDAVLLYGEAGR